MKHRLTFLIAGLFASGFLAAACSSTGPNSPPVASVSSSASATASSSGSARASALAYSRCMRAHGISDFPDPAADGSLKLGAQPGRAIDPDTQLPTRRASRRGHRRKRLAAAVVVLAVLIGAGVIVDHTRPYGISLAHPPGVRHHAKPSRGGNAAATTTAAIARRSLSARTSLDGTLGYAGDYTVAGQGRGTITWLPAVGQVIHQGQVLYRVDGQPVMLLYGATPV